MPSRLDRFAESTEIFGGRAGRDLTSGIDEERWADVRESLKDVLANFVRLTAQHSERIDVAGERHIGTDCFAHGLHVDHVIDVEDINGQIGNSIQQVGNVSADVKAYKGTH